MPLHAENILIDGITYELSVREGEPDCGQYFGACFCKVCWKGEIRYDLKPTIGDAREAGRVLAHWHHSQVHAEMAKFGS